MSTSKKKTSKKKTSEPKQSAEKQAPQEVSFEEAVAEEQAAGGSNVVPITAARSDESDEAKFGELLPKTAKNGNFKASLLQTLDDQGVLFNVREEGVFSDSGIQFDSRKMLINESTNTPMGIVSTNYNTVSNERIFDAFSDALVESGIDTSDMAMRVSFANGGAKTLVNFRFPNEVVKIKGDKSDTILEIVVLNSFDGSTRYMTKAGGFRMKCLNGQLLGKIMGSYSSFHNQALNVEAGAKQLVGMLEQFKTAEVFWTALMERPVSDELAYTLIGEYFNRDDVTADASGTAVRQMLTAWDRYRMEMGANAYSLYNAMTDFVSNKTYIPETRATGMLYNQNRLQTILNKAPVFAMAA